MKCVRTEKKRTEWLISEHIKLQQRMLKTEQLEQLNTLRMAAGA